MFVQMNCQIQINSKNAIFCCCCNWKWKPKCENIFINKTIILHVVKTIKYFLILPNAFNVETKNYLSFILCSYLIFGNHQEYLKSLQIYILRVYKCHYKIYSRKEMGLTVQVQNTASNYHVNQYQSSLK